MKKSISIAVVITICLTLALILPVSAAKEDKSGPAEKATGSVHSNIDVGWYVEFAAHEQEEIGGLPVGKGTMKHWNAGRVLRFEVKYVDVEDNKAWFAAKCISDTKNNAKVDHWVFVEVEDLGEPGIGVDKLGWNWPLPYNPHEEQEAEAIDRVVTHEDTGWSQTIDEGNLQVHTRKIQEVYP